MNPGILIALVGLAVLVGTNYASALDRASQELIVQPQLKLKDPIKSKGLSFELYLEVKNPTNGSFGMHTPSFKIMYQGSVLASTNPSPKVYPIKPFSTINTDTISLKADYMQMLLVGAELEKAFSSGKPVTMQVETLSTVYTAAGQVPMKQSDELVLQR